MTRNIEKHRDPCNDIGTASGSADYQIYVYDIMISSLWLCQLTSEVAGVLYKDFFLIMQKNFIPKAQVAGSNPTSSFLISILLPLNSIQTHTFRCSISRQK